MAHRLLSDPHSRCAVPHGHNEYVRVELSPTAGLNEITSEWGDANRKHNFEDVKSKWHEFVDNSLDHSLQLSVHDPLLAYFQNHEPIRLKNVLTTKGDPTTEALCIALSQKLRAILISESLPYRIDRLSIEETPTNTIILTPSNLTNELDLGSWCRRPDFSINDIVPPHEWASF